MGFHMVDLFSGLEVIAAHGKIATNLFMGFIFVAVVYFILGGRSFCSWACPYGLLSEWGEILHKKLVHAGLIKKEKRSQQVGNSLLPCVFGFKLFLRLSCLSIYQSCRHNLKNSDLRPLRPGSSCFSCWSSRSSLPTSLVQVRMPFRSNFRTPWKSLFNPNPSRHHKMRQMRSMHPECHVPEALKVVFAKDAQPTVFITSTDCTMCGKCMDVCDRQVFSYSHRLKKLV